MSFEDRAQDHEAQEWAIINQPREVARYALGEPGYGPADCQDCGAEMHPVRRGYGFNLCTPCQSALEPKPTGRRL